jgi:hypothetical protein
MAEHIVSRRRKAPAPSYTLLDRIGALQAIEIAMAQHRALREREVDEDRSDEAMDDALSHRDFDGIRQGEYDNELLSDTDKY